MDIINTFDSLYKRGLKALEFDRNARLEPDREKVFKRFFRNQEAARLLGITHDQLRYLLKTEKSLAKAEGRIFPSNMSPTRIDGKNKGWTISAINNIREVYAGNPRYKIFNPRKAEGETAARIAVPMFKGGAGKSTTCIHTAIHLALRGYRVLVVDCDAQATTSMQFKSFNEINGSKTIDDYLTAEWDRTHNQLDDKSLLDSSAYVQSTYVPNLDLLPANLYLYETEISFPVRQYQDSEYDLQFQLDKMLSNIDDDYDVIIMDTAPSMSYLTINALFAANMVLMPIPAKEYDFESSLMFFNMVSGLMKTFKNLGVQVPDYDVIKILTSKFGGKASEVDMDATMRAAFSNFKMLFPMLDSDAIGGASGDRTTVLEINGCDYNGSQRTYKRATDMLSKVMWEVECLILGRWSSKAELLEIMENKEWEAA